MCRSCREWAVQRVSISRWRVAFFSGRRLGSRRQRPPADRSRGYAPDGRAREVERSWNLADVRRISKLSISIVLPTEHETKTVRQFVRCVRAALPREQAAGVIVDHAEDETPALLAVVV